MESNLRAGSISACGTDEIIEFYMAIKKSITFLLALSLLASGCRQYEISNLTSAPEIKLIAKSMLPMTVDIVHKRDQMLLSDAESSVEVTQYFSKFLAGNGLFEKVRYPVSGKEVSDLTLRIDFERNFKPYRLSNVGKNLLMLGTVFLFYPWIHLKIDYEISGEVTVEKNGKILKTYREKSVSRVLMQFFAPVNDTADALSEMAMRGISEKLTEDFLKDEGFYLTLLTERKE